MSYSTWFRVPSLATVITLYNICSFIFSAPVQAAFNSTYGIYNLNSTYYSRPDLIAPKFQISVHDESVVLPGYILITPVTQAIESSIAAGLGGFTFSNASSSGTPQAQLAAYLSQSIQGGPYIYDLNGDLVYSGFGSAGFDTINLKIAQFQGKTHLTYFNGDNQNALSGTRGHGLIVDSSYRTVTTVAAGLGRTSNDAHEFTVLEDGTAIATVYQPIQYDLSQYGVNQALGWVVEGIFQHIDIKTGNVLFEWRSLDHTTPADSYFTLNVASGVGASMGNPYDYFHINSVQIDQYGNYIVSSRHLSAVFYLSGKDGSVIWQLNGKANDFSFIGFNATFAFQHDARIRWQNETFMEISLFDNGSNGQNTTTSASSGMIIALDMSAKTATLQQQFFLPDGGILTTSQGSMQTLSVANSSADVTKTNVFIGWGSNPLVSEHKPDGTPVYIAQFGTPREGLAQSYRAFRIGVDDWHATPLSTPALWTVATSNSMNSNTSTTFYVSWNGATDVASWRFYGVDAATGNATASTNTTLVPYEGEGSVLGEVAKAGFETTFMAGGFYAAGFAQAIGKQGQILGISPVKTTYVPSG